MLIRVILVLVVLYLLYRLLKSMVTPSVWKDSSSEKRLEINEELVEDPFCHTFVPIGTAFKAVIAGKTVYFCSPDCYEKLMTEEESGSSMTGDRKVK